MNEYIMSCNLKKFDLVEHFKGSSSVIWKQARKCQTGDIVYVYLGVPYSRLGYKCEVLSAHLNQCTENGSIYLDMQKNPPQEFMKLKLLCVLPDKGLSLEELRMNGLRTVQCTTLVSEELHDYIYEVLRKKA